jgi:hypothetical protein
MTMTNSVDKISARTIGVDHHISGRELRSFVGGRVTLLQNIRRMLRAKLAETLPDEDANVKFRTQYFLMRANPDNASGSPRWGKTEPLGSSWTELPGDNDLLVISLSAIIEWQASDNVGYP